MLLDIEMKIGELAYNEPQARGKITKGGGSTPSIEPPKHERQINIRFLNYFSKK